MKWHRVALALVGAALVGCGGLDSVVPASQMCGIITISTGSVLADYPDGTQVIVRPMNVICEPARLRLVPAASATVVCANDRSVEVSGTTQWMPSDAVCSGGTALAAGTYGSLAGLDSGAGPDNSKSLTAPTRERESDYGNIPILLSPRNTTVLAGRPTLRWVGLEQALEYAIALTGPHPFKVTVPAAEVTCAPDLALEAPVCSLAYPADQPELDPGSKQFLAISARAGFTDPWRVSEEVIYLNRLDSAREAAVQRAAAGLTALGMDPGAQQVALADLYRQHGLYADALESLAAYPALASHPPLLIDQGDLYSAIKLYRPALDSYTTALAALPADESLLRAQAEFGLGQVKYAYGRYGDAAPHYELASQMFGSLDLQRQSELAASGAVESRRRIAK